MRTVEEYMKMPYRIELTPDIDEGGFIVSYPDLPGCLSMGESVEEAYRNALEAKYEWIKAAIEMGRNINEPASVEDYSGQFKLRMPKSLHKSLAEHSKQEGISMNQYCLYLLSKNDAIHTAS